VVYGSAEGPPQEELIKTAETSIRVAADEVHIEPFEIARRIRSPGDYGVGKPVDVAREECLDAVSKRLAKCLRPLSLLGYI
jgi:hypothetical protein